MQTIHIMIDQLFNDSLDVCIKNCLKFEDGSIQLNEQNIDDLIESDNELLRISDGENLNNFVSQNMIQCILPLQASKYIFINKENKVLDSVLFDESEQLSFKELISNPSIDSLFYFSQSEFSFDKRVRNQAVLLLIREISTSFDNEIQISLLKKYPDILIHGQVLHDINGDFNSMIIDTFSEIFDSIIEKSIRNPFSIQANALKNDLDSLQNYQLNSLTDYFDIGEFDSDFTSKIINQTICSLSNYQHSDYKYELNIGINLFDEELNLQFLNKGMEKIEKFHPNQENYAKISINKAVASFSQNLDSILSTKLIDAHPDILFAYNQDHYEEEENLEPSEQFKESIKNRFDELFTTSLNKSITQSFLLNFTNESIFNEMNMQDHLTIDDLYEGEIDFDFNLESISNCIMPLNCFHSNLHQNKIDSIQVVDDDLNENYAKELVQPVAKQIENLFRFFSTMPNLHQIIQHAENEIQIHTKFSFDESFSNFIDISLKRNVLYVYNFENVQQSPLFNINLTLKLDKEISNILSNCLNKILDHSNMVIYREKNLQNI